MSATVANSAVFWIALLVTLAALYVLPTAIGLIRHVENLALVVILNLIPVGWPAALVVACMMPPKDDAQRLPARACIAYEPRHRCMVAGLVAGESPAARLATHRTD
jgi:nitric oxide reductase large subunit